MFCNKFIACASAVLGVSGMLSAADVTWTGAAKDGNKWSTACNWDTGVPTSADVAVFNAGEATMIDVDTDAATAKQLKIESASKALTFGGAGTLTLPTAGNSRLAASESEPVVCNLNCAQTWTTFDCKVSLTASGKINIPPATVFNGDVTIPDSTWVSVVPISGATPSDDLARVVVHGNFSSPKAAFYCLDPLSELYVDIADATKSFQCGNFGFTVNGGAATTCGKATFKQGLVKMNVPSCGTTDPVTDRFVIDGATVIAGEANQNLTNGFRFVSGTYSTTKVVNTGWTYPTRLTLMGFEDGILGAGKTTVINASYADSAYFYDATEPELVIDGTIVATNVNSSLRLCYNKGPSAPIFRGSGEIVARVLNNAKKWSTCTFDGLTLTLGEGFQPAQGNTTAVFSDATLKSYGDWKHGGTNTGSYKLQRSVVFDTADAFGGATPHQVWLGTVTAGEAVDLTVQGGGTVAHVFGAATQTMDKLTIADDTTYIASNATSLVVGELTLGRNAKLALNSGTVRAGKVVTGDGAAIDVPFSTDGKGSISADQLTQNGSLIINVIAEIPATTTDATYAVLSGVALDPKATTVNFTSLTATPYAALVTAGGALLVPSAVTPTADYEWTGAENGNWNNVGNWTALPPEGAQLFVSGSRRLAIYNDFSEGTAFGSLTFRETAGPHVVSGAALAFTNGVTSTSFEPTVKTIVSAMRGGVQTFDCDVSFAHPTAVLEAANGGALRFNGKVTTKPGGYADHLYLGGTVQFGGTADIDAVHLLDGAVLEVLDGGKVSVTNQSNYAAQSLQYGKIIVREGGSFDWAWSNGKAFCFIKASQSHQVDGTMHISKYGQSDGLPLSFEGRGHLEIDSLNYLKDQTLTVGKGLTLTLGSSFATVDENDSATHAQLLMSDATLRVRNDWTYGPADAVTDLSTVGTTREQRALKLSGACTIDTQDPDEGIAHTVTVAESIDGSAGSLTKKGAGVLALAAEDETLTNDFTGGLTVEEGGVLLPAPNVKVRAGDVVFASGAALAMPAEQRAKMESWTTVLRAKSVTGLPTDPDGKLAFRVVEGTDEVLLQARRAMRGLIVVFR